MTEKVNNFPILVYQLAGCGIATMVATAHTYVRGELNKMVEINPGSIEGRLLYNGGDLGDGFLATVLADMTLRIVGVSSTRWRNRLNIALGSTTVVLAETVSLPGEIFGKPDIEDIPAGLLGVACYLGMSLWVHRKQRSEALASSESPTLNPT